MATQYRVYKGDSSGGPVDYTTVVATTASLSYAAAALSASTTTKFGVRTYDTVSTLDDAHTDAQVTIIVDGSGADVTNRPYPPSSLRALPAVGTAATVEWTYPHTDATTRPTGFHIYIGTPTISYASSVATVLWATGLGTMRFRGALSGLTPGSTYQVGVRAYNATGEEPNTTVASLVMPSAAPTDVASLAGTVGY